MALDLSAALSQSPRCQPLLDGSQRVEGLNLTTTGVHGSEMFWRQLKYREFDISEMSMASLSIARANGDTEWAAIPVFTSRHFFHTRVLVRKDAGIDKPADLAGKRVGVPEYQQTAAVWSRGILSDEYGVDPRTLNWWMERNPEQSHGGSTGFTPPAGIRLEYIPLEKNIGSMMLSGELDATILYLVGNNLVDRSRADLANHPDIRTLFPEPNAEAQRFYKKTTIYPINHCVVLRKSLHDKHPWIALNLYQAFRTVAETLAASRKRDLDPWVQSGLIDRAAASAIGVDPWPYGIKANALVLNSIQRYLFEQGLVPRQLSLEEIFVPSSMEL